MVMLLSAHIVSEPAPVDLHVVLGAFHWPALLGSYAIVLAASTSAPWCPDCAYAPTPITTLKSSLATLCAPPRLVANVPRSVTLYPPTAVEA